MLLACEGWPSGGHIIVEPCGGCLSGDEALCSCIVEKEVGCVVLASNILWKSSELLGARSFLIGSDDDC